MKVFDRLQNRELDSFLRKGKKLKTSLSKSPGHSDTGSSRRNTSSDASLFFSSSYEQKDSGKLDITSDNTVSNDNPIDTEEHVDHDNLYFLTKTNSVVVDDNYSPHSFYDTIGNQIYKNMPDNEDGDIDSPTKGRNINDEQVVCDNFTIKDISSYLLNKQTRNFSDDFAECTDFVESMKNQQHLTLGDFKKNAALNKIKHYMTEYYRLLEAQNIDSNYNPLKTIRDRELKLQLHSFDDKKDENLLSNTTKNFQKLMKNYQNVIQDPPLIPVLAFSKRSNANAAYKKFHDNLSEDEEAVHSSSETNKKDHHNPYYAYKLNHSTHKKKANSYQYWKWFVGVNEKYEDINIQKILHLKQEFMSTKSNDEQNVSKNADQTNLLKIPYNESRNLSSEASESYFSDDDSEKDYADVNEGLGVPMKAESKDNSEQTNGSEYNKKGMNKIVNLINNTINSLELYEQSKLEKVIYFETLIRVLINSLDTFQYEKNKELNKLECFQVPSLKSLEDLKDEIVLDLSNCENLTRISENNELTKMVLDMTHIQSEISTTLQLRYKKIGSTDFDTDSHSSYTTIRHKRRSRDQKCCVANIGFWLIEWMIKFILVSIKISYGLYSFIFPSKNKKTPESSGPLKKQ